MTESTVCALNFLTSLLLTISIHVRDSNWVVKLIWLFAYIKGNLRSSESKGIAIISSKSLQAYSAICTTQHFHPYLVVLLTLCSQPQKRKQQTTKEQQTCLYRQNILNLTPLAKTSISPVLMIFILLKKLLFNNLLYGK